MRERGDLTQRGETQKLVRIPVPVREGYYIASDDQKFAVDKLFGADVHVVEGCLEQVVDDEGVLASD